MNIAIFFHVFTNGTDQGVNILCEQMNALKESGLGAAARMLFIVGETRDALLASTLAGDNATVRGLGHKMTSERPTMALMQDWLPGHEDWFVLYLHPKGVTYPHDSMARWRRCMEKACVWNWEQCVKDLAGSFDTVGAHWMTHQRGGGVGRNQRYWGGNFWWATGAYLLTLPPLPAYAGGTGKYYDGESWIGTGPQAPHFLDYASHWPMTGCK